MLFSYFLIFLSSINYQIIVRLPFLTENSSLLNKINIINGEHHS